MGRRRGQHWAADAETPTTAPAYGLDLESGIRVSVFWHLLLDVPLAARCSSV